MVFNFTLAGGAIDLQITRRLKKPESNRVLKMRDQNAGKRHFQFVYLRADINGRPLPSNSAIPQLKIETADHCSVPL
jgi:hypothetical protein